jgi:hypothetical protein
MFYEGRIKTNYDFELKIFNCCIFAYQVLNHSK